MRRSLIRHPDTPCAAVTAIAAEVVWTAPGRLQVRYIVTGDAKALRMPAPATPARAEGLWRHTCFEAFVQGAYPAYREFNFAPSGEWAAYDFDGYRQGTRAADAIDPRVEVTARPDGFELIAAVGVETERPVRLGLSAVIEEADGRLSYWALAHPPGKPDFHHDVCFQLEVPARPVA